MTQSVLLFIRQFVSTFSAYNGLGLLQNVGDCWIPRSHPALGVCVGELVCHEMAGFYGAGHSEVRVPVYMVRHFWVLDQPFLSTWTYISTVTRHLRLMNLATAPPTCLINQYRPVCGMIVCNDPLLSPCFLASLDKTTQEPLHLTSGLLTTLTLSFDQASGDECGSRAGRVLEKSSDMRFGLNGVLVHA